jgi:small subunit ribosomal protein S6
MAEAGGKGWSGERSLRTGGKGNRMSRVYEVMFIVRPDVADEDVDKLIAGFTATITSGGGAVKTAEKMGRRKLAYTVRKFNDGNYVLLTIEADGAGVLELERRLRVTEQIIKFITVRMDEEEKRLAKVKALRGVRRSAMPAAVATPAAAEAAPVAPAAAVEAAAPETVAQSEATEAVQASA